MNQSLLTDEAIIKDLGKRSRQARLDANITQNELARESGVGKRTLERFENGSSIQLTSFIRILRTLGHLENFTQLIPDSSNSPIALLKKENHTRHRATGTRSNKQNQGGSPSDSWEWND